LKIEPELANRLLKIQQDGGSDEIVPVVKSCDGIRNKGIDLKKVVRVDACYTALDQVVQNELGSACRGKGKGDDSVVLGGPSWLQLKESLLASWDRSVMSTNSASALGTAASTSASTAISRKRLPSGKVMDAILLF
jgi:hypothetical protein